MLVNLPVLPTITVVNKHHGAAGVGHYVGRGSPLGNPFIMIPHGEFSREEAIRHHSNWFSQQVEQGNVQIISELRRLAKIAINDGELKIQCFCTPKSCHATTIKNLLLELIEFMLTEAGVPMLEAA